MKRTYRILAIALVIMSCDKNNPEPATEPALNCDCDRIISHTKFNLPGGGSFGEYVTINDCTEVQTDGNWSTQWGDTEPVNGNCI